MSISKIVVAYQLGGAAADGVVEGREARHPQGPRHAVPTMLKLDR